MPETSFFKHNGSGDTNHVRVMQRVAGSRTPNPTRCRTHDQWFSCGNAFFHRTTNAAGKAGRTTGSSCPPRFPGCIGSPMEKRVPTITYLYFVGKRSNTLTGCLEPSWPSWSCAHDALPPAPAPSGSPQPGGALVLDCKEKHTHWRRVTDG